ncbi:MAG: inosine/xanthosine triphosphatase [Candidatus Magasanikbacteria bacterium]|nr:inosine/xanthosine triphosphatase [Candidatus Magasanikbacteria bacterium]
MKVAVGSTNPVKINATKQAFAKVWPNNKWEVVGLEISSGVSNQPMSDLESIKGATNRAKGALKAGKADFGVGLEGGVQKTNGMWFDTGWVVVIDKNGVVGIGTSIRMQSPPVMMEYVNKGMELGHIDDMLFGKKNSKHKQGHFGLMTRGVLVREEAYQHGVISALARFLHPKLFEK